MTQQVRTLTENPCFSACVWQFTTACNSSSLFWPLQALHLCAHIPDTDTYHTPIHIIKNKIHIRAQRLREVGAFREDSSLVPSMHVTGSALSVTPRSLASSGSCIHRLIPTCRQTSKIKPGPGMVANPLNPSTL